MKCHICGSDYVGLGVHVKHKHQLTAREYKAEFDIPMTTPLVDAELSAHLSRMAKITMSCPIRKAEATEICKRNTANSKLVGSKQHWVESTKSHKRKPPVVIETPGIKTFWQREYYEPRMAA